MLYLKKLMIDNKLEVKQLEKDIFNGGFKVRNLLSKHTVSIDTLKRIKVYLVEKSIINENFDIGTFLDEV